MAPSPRASSSRLRERCWRLRRCSCSRLQPVRRRAQGWGPQAGDDRHPLGKHHPSPDPWDHDAAIVAHVLLPYPGESGGRGPRVWKRFRRKEKGNGYQLAPRDCRVDPSVGWWRLLLEAAAVRKWSSLSIEDPFVDCSAGSSYRGAPLSGPQRRIPRT